MILISQFTLWNPRFIYINYKNKNYIFNLTWDIWYIIPTKYFLKQIKYQSRIELNNNPNINEIYVIDSNSKQIYFMYDHSRHLYWCILILTYIPIIWHHQSNIDMNIKYEYYMLMVKEVRGSINIGSCVVGIELLIIFNINSIQCNMNE